MHTEDPSPSDADRIDALSEKLDRLTGTVEELAGLQRRLADGYAEAMPILKDVMAYGADTLDGYEKRGYFTAGRAALDVVDRVVTAYDADELRRFGDSIVAILDTVRALTQPEVLAIASEASAALQHADDTKPVGLGGMMRASRDEDVQRGMAVLLDVLRHVGRAADHLQHGDAPAPAVRAAAAAPAPKAAVGASPRPAPTQADLSQQEVVFEGLRFLADGTLLDRDGWTESLAEKLAPTVGVEALNEQHWAVIRFAREEFTSTGKSPNIRRLTQGSGVDTRTLYTLFPQAPGRAVARVAGLPRPVGCL